MTVSPYITAAMERARLPIKVKCFGDGDLLLISDDEWRMTFTTPHADIASSRYLRLCESLSATLPADAAAPPSNSAVAAPEASQIPEASGASLSAVRA